MATGRSDFPNQVNNVLGFPFIFRGALDARANEITQDMLIAAVYALAELAREPVPASVLKAYKLKKLCSARTTSCPSRSIPAWPSACHRPWPRRRRRRKRRAEPVQTRNLNRAVKPVARPVYLNLFRIHLPLAGWVSILHRVSGALLFVALPLGVWVLSVSLANEAGFRRIAGWLAHPLGKLVLLLLIAAFAQHLFAGLRHLALDAHWGVSCATRPAEQSRGHAGQCGW